MIDTISVTFNKSTNNFNIPFAVIAPKGDGYGSPSNKDTKKDGYGRSPSAFEMSRPHLNNDDAYSAFPNGNDPYSNVIGIQALFSQDNILDFDKFDGEDRFIHRE